MKKNGQYVGVDEKYIPEDEKYVDNSTNGEVKDAINNGINAAKDYITDKDNQEKIKKAGKKGLKILKGIGIGYLALFVFIIVMAIVVFILIFSNFFKMRSTANKINGGANEIIDKANEIINKTEENVDSENSAYEAASFNSGLETYAGTKYGSQVSSLLDRVVIKIKKNSEHLISVVYGSETVSTPDEIIKLKSNFDDWTKYEVSLDYDSNGFVNKVTIFDK